MEEMLIVLKNLQKEFPDGFRLVIREEGAGSVETLQNPSAFSYRESYYAFDTIHELFYHYGWKDRRDE